MKKISVTLLAIVLATVFGGLFFRYFSYFGTTRTVVIQSGGSERKYEINTSSTGGQKTPLLVVLHGYGDHPRLIEFYTGFSRLARRQNFTVVYPYGTNTSKKKKLSWNAGSCCNPALEQEVDDVAFIESVIHDVSENYLVDPERIYITGFSNGAMMAGRMLAERTELFAAGAMVSGAVGGRVDEYQSFYTMTTPTRQLPVLLIHGEADTVVPFSGGKNNEGSAEFTSFQDLAQFWISHNNCTIDPLITETEVVSKKEYSNCNRKTLVTVSTIKKLAHTWSGNPVDIITHLFSERFDTSREVWSFLKIAKRLD